MPMPKGPQMPKSDGKPGPKCPKCNVQFSGAGALMRHKVLKGH